MDQVKMMKTKGTHSGQRDTDFPLSIRGRVKRTWNSHKALLASLCLLIYPFILASNPVGERMQTHCIVSGQGKTVDEFPQPFIAKVGWRSPSL